MKGLIVIRMLVWGIVGLSLLSYEGIQRVREFACGHGAPAIAVRRSALSSRD
jgi:hypothetical protein